MVVEQTSEFCRDLPNYLCKLHLLDSQIYFFWINDVVPEPPRTFCIMLYSSMSHCREHIMSQKWGGILLHGQEIDIGSGQAATSNTYTQGIGIAGDKLIKVHQEWMRAHLHVSQGTKSQGGWATCHCFCCTTVKTIEALQPRSCSVLVFFLY